jgi:MerR family transcriptional regulator, copper efflux regulator
MMSGQLIGMAAKAAGLNPRTLRFYERVGLLPRPARTRAGYRVYSDDALARLAFIGRAKDLGLNLKEIRGILEQRDRGNLSCSTVRDMLTDRVALLDAQIARLRTFRSELAAILAESPEIRGRSGRSQPGHVGAVCPIIERFADSKSIRRLRNGNRPAANHLHGGIKP